MLLLIVHDLCGDFDVQDGNHSEDADHILVLLLGEGAQKGLPVLVLQERKFYEFQMFQSISLSSFRNFATVTFIFANCASDLMFLFRE